ncbi:MAG: protein kinase [Planctomycetaceae bacterium]
MSDDDRLSDILLQWMELSRQGHRPTAKALCHDAPELVEPVRRRIESLEYMQTLLGLDDEKGAPDGDHTQARALPEWDASTTVEIPGYDVFEMLDRGGMGVVFRARQRELQRYVAVKILADLYRAPDRIARFRVEAESVARLQHPNIVQIYEVGEFGGRPFYSMELVDGGSLAQKLAESRPSPQDSAAIVETLARATHAAHQRGIIHRDLKPANILLALDGTPKIADFGLAKRLDDDSSQTKTGEIMGTPSYMAPEQAEGRPEQIGPAADVYALGAILFEMLTGKPPFRASTMLKLLGKAASQDAAFPRNQRTNIPRDLQAICLKCLEKRPGRRYREAERLADDLRRVLNGEPIVARRIGPIRRLAKWSKRRPAWALLAGIALAATVALAAIGWNRYRERRQRRIEAVRLAPQAREILQRNCFECHGRNPQKIEKGLNGLDHSSLVDSDRRNVVPGSPDDSRLIQRIADGSMPLESEEVRLPRVSEQELVILRRWIAGGAPEFPPVDPRNPTPPVVPDSPLARQAKGIFHRRCYECHKHSVAKGGIKILHHRLLLTVRKVVIPGDAESSELFQLITAKPDNKIVMPPEGEARLPAEEIAVIRRWINTGAPPFPKD